MIIRDIYFGTSFIRRVYQNGKLIRVDVPISVIRGKAEIASFCTALLADLKAINMNSYAISISESDAPLWALKAATANVRAETTTDASAGLVVVTIVPLTSVANSVIYTSAKCYAVRYVIFGSVAVKMFFYTTATAHSHKAALAKSKVTLGIETFVKDLRCFAPLSLAAESRFATSASAEAQKIEPKDMGGGSSKSASSAAGKLTLWRIPAVANGILEIRSAFGASVTDGILEVI